TAPLYLTRITCCARGISAAGRRPLSRRASCNESRGIPLLSTNTAPLPHPVPTTLTRLSCILVTSLLGRVRFRRRQAAALGRRFHRGPRTAGMGATVSIETPASPARPAVASQQTAARRSARPARCPTLLREADITANLEADGTRRGRS